MAAVFAKQGFVEILGKGGGGDEQLGRGRTHDSSEDGRQNQPGRKRTEQQVGHYQKNGFAVAAGKRSCQINSADHANENRSCEGEDNPSHCNSGSLLNFGRRSDCHKAHEDMRLAEIAESPAEQGNEFNEGQHRSIRLGERIEILWIDGVEGREGCRNTTDGIDRSHWHDQNSKEHHDPLDEIRPADSKEAADQGVKDDDECPEQHGIDVRDTKNGFKQLAARDESGGCVDDEKDQDEYRGNDA